MKPVIYIDVLFFVNFFINLLILFASAKIARISYERIRLFIASAAGALYAVFMFFPKLGFIYGTGAKIISSMGMTALAYNIKGIKSYIKAFVVFCIVTLSFGGAVFAVFCFTGLGSTVGAVSKNAILYINLPWQALLASVGGAYLAVTHVWRTAKNTGSRQYVTICITYGGNSASTTAMVDTGNSLCEPVSRAPVIVCEYESVKSILPPDIREIYEFTRYASQSVLFNR